METVIILALFALGILFIVKGGDWFVDAASWMAEVSGIPKFIVGATVVSFATTLPELLVSVLAALEGKVDMAIGNAVGSVTANVGLIMGVSLLFLPAVIKRSKLAFKGLLLMTICALLLVFSLGHELKMGGAVVLLLLFVAFLAENIWDARRSMGTAKADVDKPTRKIVITNLVKFVLGTAGIVIGARLLVDNGSAIARLLGVPESIIGVTLVAVGTSLPELVTTVTALIKKEASLSVGNIIGANIIDLSIILPVCSLLSRGSLPVGNQSLYLDMPMCLLTLVIAIVPALWKEKFARWQGAVLLAVYAAYLVVVCTGVIA